MVLDRFELTSSCRVTLPTGKQPLSDTLVEDLDESFHFDPQHEDLVDRFIREPLEKDTKEGSLKI